jgi:hypothetical protein
VAQLVDKRVADKNGRNSMSSVRVRVRSADADPADPAMEPGDVLVPLDSGTVKEDRQNSMRLTLLYSSEVQTAIQQVCLHAMRSPCTNLSVHERTH